MRRLELYLNLKANVLLHKTLLLSSYFQSSQGMRSTKEQFSNALAHCCLLSFRHDEKAVGQTSPTIFFCIVTLVCILDLALSWGVVIILFFSAI